MLEAQGEVDPIADEGDAWGQEYVWVVNDGDVAFTMEAANDEVAYRKAIAQRIADGATPEEAVRWFRDADQISQISGHLDVDPYDGDLPGEDRIAGLPIEQDVTGLGEGLDPELVGLLQGEGLMDAEDSVSEDKHTGDFNKRVIHKVVGHIRAGGSDLKKALETGLITLGDVVRAIRNNRCLRMPDRDFGATYLEQIVGTAIRETIPPKNINAVRGVFGLKKLPPGELAGKKGNANVNAPRRPNRQPG